MILGPGFHRIDAATYHADPCERPSLSSTIARVLVGQSPLHAYSMHPRLGGRALRQTRSMSFGTLVHALVLGQGGLVEVIPADDWRTKAAREARDEAREAGRIPILADEFEPAQKCADATIAAMAKHGIALTGESELAVIWEETIGEVHETFANALPMVHRGTPVLCRGMLDHWVESTATIYDVKTTESANPKELASKFIRFGYDIQRAAYVSAVETLRPDLRGRVRFVFVFVETEPPFDVVPVIAGGSMRDLGESRWSRAVHVWDRALRSNRWPGYAERATQIEAPAWAMVEEEDRRHANV